MNLDIVGLDKWGISCKKTMLIAGPCSVESEEQIMQTARSLAGYDVSLLRGGIWKPRTRPGNFEGIGEPALKWLKQAGKAVNTPVAVEIASPEHLDYCLKYGIDVVWIGARTTSNPFAVQAGSPYIVVVITGGNFGTDRNSVRVRLIGDGVDVMVEPIVVLLDGISLAIDAPYLELPRLYTLTVVKSTKQTVPTIPTIPPVDEASNPIPLVVYEPLFLYLPVINK